MRENKYITVMGRMTSPDKLEMVCPNCDTVMRFLLDCDSIILEVRQEDGFLTACSQCNQKVNGVFDREASEHDLPTVKER